MTCDEPICHDCTVLDHPRPDHKQVDLKNAAEERVDKLQEMLKQVEGIPDAIDLATAEDSKTIEELEANATKAIKIYKKTVKKAEYEFTQEVRRLQQKRKKEIEEHLDNLQSKKARLCTTLEMTQEITRNGSEHDAATMYSSLYNSMQQLAKINTRAVRKSMGKVEFKPSDNLDGGLRSVGCLNTYEQWTFEKTLCEFTAGRNVVVDRNGRIAVSTIHDFYNIRIFDEHGACTRQLHTLGVGGSGESWGLAIAENGDYFITDCNPYVKIFDEHGNFKKRFTTRRPNGRWSHEVRSQLYGLAIDKKSRVYVGSSNHRYISVHSLDGTHISSFNVNLTPYFIAITPEYDVIVSDYCNSLSVHIYDINGTQLRTFDAPPDSNFYPTGVCVGGDEVYVASYKEIPAVYRYSLRGEFIGIVTKEVPSPWGLCITDDEDRLHVCDNDSVKVFQRK